MYKKVLTVIITSSLIGNPLFASNFFQKYLSLPLTQNANTVIQLKSNDKVNNFVDFSGTWVGSCTGNDELAMITIANSDTQLLLNGKIFNIGSLETESTSNKDASYFFHILLDWNADHSSLLFNDSYASHYHMQDLNEKRFGYEMGSISLKNEMLIYEVSSHNSDVGIETSVCTYRKQ